MTRVSCCFITLDTNSTGNMEEIFNTSIPTDNTEHDSLRIIHPIHKQSDLLAPFCHALVLASASKGELEIIDVRKERERSEHVSIRKVFEQWHLLPPGSSREDVGKLGIRVKKIVKDGGMKKEISKRLRRRQHDILVIGIKAATGITRLFGQDLTDYLVQYFRQTTLYIPSGAKSFVDEKTGSVTLKKIVIPVADDPSPEPSFHLLQRLISVFPDQSPHVRGLHIGEIFPHISAASLEGISWEEECIREGAIVPSVIAMARKEDADLIVMSTNGRDTFQQKVIGSITEQVLAQAPCPVLAVAVD